MKPAKWIRFIGFVAAGGTAVSQAQPKKLDVETIERVTGLKATVVDAESVVRVTAPRSDVKVRVDGTLLPPFAGLTSWAAFKPGETSEAMVMGDLVLMQDEVNPVMDACFAGELTVTALHNHFLYDEPKVFFMHIGGEGTVEHLAGGVRKAFDAIKEVRAATPRPASGFGGTPIAERSNVTAGPIEDIFGKQADSKDGMLKFSFGRTVKMSCGCEVGNAMGVNTWAAFVGTDDHALVDGDFACLPGELQPTLKALRHAGINIVAIHNHMEDESPRVTFLHYWGNGMAVDLARGVKNTLDAQARVSTRKGADDRQSDRTDRTADTSTQATAVARQPWLADTAERQRDQMEKHLRGLDVAMMEVGYRFVELFFAGHDGNWDYAKYQIEKIELATQLALERRPQRAASAEPFLRETIPLMKQAIEDARRTRDVRSFDDAMERLRMDCMKCHVSENVPYFTVYFPEQRQSPIRTVR